MTGQEWYHAEQNTCPPYHLEMMCLIYVTFDACNRLVGKVLTHFEENKTESQRSKLSKVMELLSGSFPGHRATSPTQREMASDGHGMQWAGA